MKIRILVILPLDGGSLIVALHCLDALTRLKGVQVDTVATQHLFNLYDKSFQHIEKIDERRRAVVEHINLAAMGRLVTFKPDLVWILALAPITPWFIDSANALGVVTAHWYVENYLYYPKDPVTPAWQLVAPHYQYFFTIQKGAFHDELKKTGVKNCHYLPAACNPWVYHKKAIGYLPTNRFDSEIGFVGFHYPNRIKIFKELKRFQIKLWGPGWNQIPELQIMAKNGGAWVDSATEAKIIKGTKIGLNIHSTLDPNVVVPRGDFLNPRVFTIPACGTFQLVDEQDPLSEVYDIGEEVEVYSDLDSLKSKLRYYLEDDVARNRIAEKGYERTLGEHTYSHRMTSMLKTVGLW